MVPVEDGSGSNAVATRGVGREPDVSGDQSSRTKICATATRRHRQDRAGHAHQLGEEENRQQRHQWIEVHCAAKDDAGRARSLPAGRYRRK
jgi:hypothetical protein